MVVNGIFERKEQLTLEEGGFSSTRLLELTHVLFYWLLLLPIDLPLKFRGDIFGLCIH
jgi:hypothetical protein